MVPIDIHVALNVVENNTTNITCPKLEIKLYT